MAEPKNGSAKGDFYCIFGLFFSACNGNSQLIKLCGVDGSGALGHKLACVLNLGEGGHIAQGVAAKQLHTKSVKTDTDSAVGRPPYLNAPVRNPNFRSASSLESPSMSKMRLCRSGVGDTNGAAGKLNAVEHQVIGLGSDLGLVGFKIVKAFVHRGGEGWCIATN